MTAFSSVGTAVEAIKSGALDYLVKPLDFDTLQQTLVQALAHTRQSESDPSVATDSRWGMIGDSPAMQALLNDITLVAPSDATVLIYGSREPVRSWWRTPSTPAASVVTSRWSRSTARR